MCGITAAITLNRSSSNGVNGTNGHGTNGHGTNGNGTNGHGNGTNGNGTNGHGTNSNGTNGNGTNGHGTNGNGTNGRNGYTNGSNGTNGYNGVNGHGKKHAILRQQLHKSLATIAHRGPDASGIWISDDGSIALGHRRLAINDLSADGEQPLHSDDDKIHAVVNGEIYDHDAIRERCIREHGYKFKGHCDSEVLVALYKIHGAPGFFEHLRGEFSFVIYDENDGRVIVARDRFGIKPMFWTYQGEGADKRILLTSEMKGFSALGWEAEWNVHGLLSGTAMQVDNTVFKNVWKLNPGTWMEITRDGEIKHQKYWDPQYKDKRELETRTLDEMIEGVRERLINAVRLRLRADVPVGIYLSGGIDSSVVAGIVTKLVREEGIKLGNQDATKRIACFTIQFPETSGFNESDIAERSAEWLGVQILKKDMNESELANNFADAVYHAEHHNFDLNSVGKFCLSTLPRQHGVPVVLTGEGADEHFAGYPFVLPSFLMEADYSWPESPLVQNDIGRMIMYKEMTDDIKEMFDRIGMFETETSSNPANTLRLEPEWNAFVPWVRDTYKAPGFGDPALSPEVLQNMLMKWHPLHSTLYAYTKGPLANMILTCLGDRTEMAHSIEARPPFLDHHLVEYVNNLPPSLKVAYSETPAEATGTGASLWWKDLSAARQKLSEKWILKEAGKPFITQELYERRKHPYSAPLKWPRGGPMHKMMTDLINKENIEQLGFMEWDSVSQWLDEGFGDDAKPRAFRKLICTASWVVLSQRFGVKKATKEQSL
ncbi:Amidase chyE [Colletotrichum orbiculare MAFF 240422]|uniref:Amidase chyE n=1 Tax=Colletotrichum orbiculare (strain 104-T / ATCC 96160 / CBS 514.97 / LARS 414 / MAFF 240422) TaxID=1213857 RepID=N4VT05_COLOR|nr:Amidase chyE [Colletotrichum orbiculare MAFF 240422]